MPVHSSLDRGIPQGFIMEQLLLIIALDFSQTSVLSLQT